MIKQTNKMFYGLFLLLTLNYFNIRAQTLPSNSIQEKVEPSIRPKVKRTQELLMFGNQQNRQVDNNAASSFLSSAEKRMLSSSGLEDSRDSIGEGETFNHIKSPSNYILLDHQMFPQQDQKYYDYGKVLVNEFGDVMNAPPYPYYNSEDRRKRSEETVTNPSTTTSASPSLPVYSTQSSVNQAHNSKSSPLYQEPRYKRESDVDPEIMFELLQAWENEHRNRDWRNLANNEYDNVETDSNLIGIEEDDPRPGINWSEGLMYSPQRHYRIGVDPLVSSDIGIPRTHPTNYDQYGSQYDQQYNIERPQYGTAQYGAIYPQHVYYPQEKRFMMARKRLQGYDAYMAQLLAASRGYPNYQRRFMY